MGVRIALAQLTTGIDPRASARVLEQVAGEAAAGGAAMLFTPEMSNLLDRDRARARASAVAEADDLVLVEARAAAKRHGLWIHLGSIAVEGRDGRLANRGIVVDERGDVAARYDKLHLFDVDLPDGSRYRESETYRAGASTAVARSPAGTVGLSICYDLRFPALYTALAQADATILSVPAAFTVPTGEAHWQVLLRARAIETGSFVVAAAQTGRHEDGRQTWGRSAVVDPWGRVLLDMGAAGGLGFVELDETAVSRARSAIPALSHHRMIPPRLTSAGPSF